PPSDCCGACPGRGERGRAPVAHPVTGPRWPGWPKCCGRRRAELGRIAGTRSGRSCSTELLRCGELSLPPGVDKLLRQGRRATLARLLAPARAQHPPRGATITHPRTWLKQRVSERLPVPLVGLDSDNGAIVRYLVANGSTRCSCALWPLATRD